MIGLIDLDLQQSSSIHLHPPNLEIMKLATYYSLEENLFCRLINLDETELTSYDKIYIFSESERYPIIPTPFMRANNVILGGTAFTNGIYLPFQNELIDYTLPRPYIYKNFLSEKHLAGISEKTINHILDDTYYRMYAGDAKLPIPPVLPHKRVYIYDKNFFVSDWKRIITTLTDRSPSVIKPIHPIICNTISNYFDIRNQPKLARDADIILDINIPLNETPILIKKFKNKFLADIKKTSNIYITLGGTFDTEYQYKKDFIYKMNLLYIYWSNKIPIKIKYIFPQIGYHDPLSHLSKLVENWTGGDTNRTKSINDRIPKDKRMTDPRPERLERDKIIESNPSAKTLFFQTR